MGLCTSYVVCVQKTLHHELIAQLCKQNLVGPLIEAIVTVDSCPWSINDEARPAIVGNVQRHKHQILVISATTLSVRGGTRMSFLGAGVFSDGRGL